MLSEEEIKAIYKLKNYIGDDDFYNIYKEIKENKRQGEAGGTHINFCKAIDTALNLITKLQKENKEKDKQIDLMTDFMIGGLGDIAFNVICKKSHCTYELKDNRLTNFRKRKLCIKQYFEKLAKEKGE